jgi:hypothetical protein
MGSASGGSARRRQPERCPPARSGTCSPSQVAAAGYLARLTVAATTVVAELKARMKTVRTATRWSQARMPSMLLAALPAAPLTCRRAEVAGQDIYALARMSQRVGNGSQFGLGAHVEDAPNGDSGAYGGTCLLASLAAQISRLCKTGRSSSAIVGLVAGLACGEVDTRIAAADAPGPAHPPEAHPPFAARGTLDC